MDRRTYLRTAGAVTVGSALAGCAATDGLSAEVIRTTTTTFGRLVMRVEVWNTAESSKSGTLVGEIDMQEGKTYTQRREVTVPGGELDSYELEFDIAMSTPLTGGQYQATASIE